MGFKKQFLDLAGRPMWLRSVDAMLYRDGVRVIVVAGQEDVSTIGETIHAYKLNSVCISVAGGATRHKSVEVGIRHVLGVIEQETLDPSEVLVAVHDAARPFVSQFDVEKVSDKALAHGAAILGTYCRDTVKWVEHDAIMRTLPREHLFLAETPQVLRGDLLDIAYAQTPTFSDFVPTDDSSLLEMHDISVACVESTSYNAKLTTPTDLEYATWLAQKLWGTR